VKSIPSPQRGGPLCALPSTAPYKHYYVTLPYRLVSSGTVMSVGMVHILTPYWPMYLFLLIQEVLGRTNRLLSLIRHGPHWKRRVQQFFYCCVCIRYRGNVSSEPLPSNDRGIFTDPLRSHDRRGYTGTQTRTHTHTHTHRQQRDPINLLNFLK
jgi:hypothetical protein